MEMSGEIDVTRLALLASPADRAREAAEELRQHFQFVSLERADAAVVLGGDGFMLDTLHRMLDRGKVIPAYGMNLGTVGFLMNRYRNPAKLAERLAKARRFAIAPLRMEAIQQDGTRHVACAINEVSLLREARQTAKIEIALAKGKKAYDKRATIAKRDEARSSERQLRVR